MEGPPGACLDVSADHRWVLSCLLFALCAGSGAAGAAAAPGLQTSIISVRSKDGTPIVAECAGAGPSLVIVHGGTGDHTRWTPLFPLFSSRFTVCAMDRRGFGGSGDSADHSLLKEAEDVAAVVNARPGKVFVFGHSYGAVCALESAFLTDKIAKLVLYEPPIQESFDPAVVSRMESAVQRGDRDQALTIILQDVVKISPSEVAAMKARPSWPRLAATIHLSLRQIRAIEAYRFDPKRISALKVPTLLLTGGETASPTHKRAIGSLQDALPDRRVVVFEGEQHNTMDTIARRFAEAVGDSLLGAEKVKP